MTPEPINANIRMCRDCGALYADGGKINGGSPVWCNCGGPVLFVGTVVITPPEEGSPMRDG